ncbi:MAG: 5-formyltetrahydrofolate cyclo-ligase [Proteobacteria bacterium]|nr:5-formyltetrahydrofolate cyclo-ligase [Pseudomonadota bacterium]MBU1714902.1 5-formyltetrahydrofolate cyclo-ligase [Pseudomonadota bacterium]
MQKLDSDRTELRRRVLAARDCLSLTERGVKSQEVMANLERIEKFRAAATILFYVNFRSEVETLGLIGRLIRQGKRIAVPLTDVAHARLRPFEIKDPAQDLRSGYCSIPEPDPDKLNKVDPAEIEVVILPGSVFDQAGGRLGYGGGYYDRFLVKEAPRACRIGVAFEMQVVPKVPLLPHDQKLHYLVTEKIIRNFVE